MPRAIRALFAALIVCALASCGPAAPAPLPTATPASGDEGVTTISFAAPEFERAAYEPLIEAFEAENPDVRVRFVSIDEVAPFEGGSFDPADQLRKTVSAADTALPMFLRREDARPELLLDLRPLMDADASFAPDDYYPGALDALTAGQARYLLPRELSVTLLSYNKDLWAAAGLPAPTPGWTWDDLLAAAERLAERRGETIETYGYADYEAGVSVILGRLAAAGDPLTGTGAASVSLDRPAVNEALEQAAALAKTGALFVPKDQDPASFQELANAIQEGRAALWAEGMLPPAGPVDAAGGETGGAARLSVGTATLPKPEVTPSFGAAPSGYVISAGTQHPAESWRWLSFLSRQQPQPPQGMMMIGGGRAVPARRSLAEQSGFWDALDAEARAALEYALDHQLAVPTSDDTDVRSSLTDALVAVMGGAAPSDALADAQAARQQRLAAPTPTPSAAGPVTVSTPESEVIPEGATVVRFSAPFMQPAQLRQAARAFSRDNPSVYVEITGGLTGVIDPAALAKQSDCFMLPGGLTDSGLLTSTLDLRPLIDADPNFDLSDYPAALLAPFQADGAQRGLPYGVTLRSLSYNAEAFKDAGLASPNAAWTLDDLARAAERLTFGQGDGRSYGFASLGPMADDLRFFLARSGVRLTAGSGAAARPALDDPALLRASQAYVDLVKGATPHTRLSGYGDEPVLFGQAYELVQSGRVGMWLDLGLGMAVALGGGPERTDFTTAIAPPPQAGAGLAPGDAQSSGMYISDASSSPEACWKWLSFLSRDTSLLGQEFPARRSLADSEAFLASARPGAAEVYQAYRAALDRPAAEQAAENIDLYWYYRAVDRAIQGKDLARELAEAQRLTAAHLDCVGAGGKPAECARAVDSSYGGR